MPKRIVQDVIPPEKRSIRNIPIPERHLRPEPRDEKLVSDVRQPRPVEDVRPAAPERREKPEGKTVHITKAPPKRVASAVNPYEWQDDEQPDVPAYAAPRRQSRGMLWGVALIALLALAFGISSLFQSVTVKVKQRQTVVPVSGVLRASSDGETGAVPFEVVRLSRDASKPVAASEEKPVERKASGKIVIYNNHSSSPQRLVKNTRFETTDGLIFRVADSVTVPGATINAGEKVPGSVEATVVADDSGDKYNIGLSDFKIPGFKGDPRYETFYARSKTPMSGGFSGMAKVVSEDVLSEARDEMQFALREQLAKEVAAQLPQGYATFDNGLVYSFEDLPQTEGNGNSAVVNMRGTVNAVMFKKTDLGRAVAEKHVESFRGGDVEIANLSELNPTIENGAAFNPETDTSFELAMAGDARIAWLYDKDALKKDLLGAARRDVDRILSRYTAIESADVVLRPFWNQSIPKDASKVQILNQGTAEQ